MVTLAGCATSDTQPPDLAARPILPPAPAAFGKPVAVRPPKAGEDARAYAAREIAGRLVANQRLRDDAAFYADVTTRFGADAALASP